jgi:hypothetical protein
MQKVSQKIIAFACLTFGLSLAPSLSAQMAVDGLSGPLTANEINSFKTYMAGRTIAANNSGNAWLFGSTGLECAAIGEMYASTGDVEILDRMIQYADTALAGRNDPNTGVTMWTGKRELCWPNSFTEPVYTSCESGEVAGHILNCARWILETPSIWNTTVAVGDPRGYGATYKTRALKYLTECDKTIDTFIIPIWVSAANGNKIYAPTNWNGDGGANGGPVAWNRISMFLAALQRSAECHEILGDDPARVANQDAIVSANIQWFLTKCVPYTSNGFACYNWFYRADTTTKYEEVWESHGALDIRMLWQSYDRGIGLSKAEMTKFANTLQYSVWTGSLFHGRFDGQDGTYGTKTYTKGEYIDLAEFVPALYQTVGLPDMSHTTDSSMIGPILWMKNRVYQQFSVASLSTSKTVMAGASTTDTVLVDPLGGFSGTVALTASGLPSGATASFSPSSISGASGSSTLTISTTASTPAGTSSVTITGTSGSTTHSDTLQLTVTGTVAGPGFSPGGGTYTSAQNVTITSATSGASIRYTLDGSTPTSTTGTVYSSPVAISTTKTLKAIAYKSGMSDSPVTSATYTISSASTNLALNQTASASTTWSATYDAAKAVDGSTSTRWSAASGQTSNQWLLVDLGVGATFGSVVIKEISFARVTAFKIQTSNDGSTFTDRATGTTIGATKTVSFTPVTARYARLFITSASGDPTIDEFEVWGTVIVPPVNLALNQTASASSIWSATYAASKAVDGSTSSSRWSAASGQTANQWVLVDLGATHTFANVVIKEVSYARVTAFKVQTSTDGTTFTDRATGTTIGANKSVSFTAVSARYVRLYLTSASDVPTIDEFEVWGN